MNGVNYSVPRKLETETCESLRITWVKVCNVACFPTKMLINIHVYTYCNYSCNSISENMQEPTTQRSWSPEHVQRTLQQTPALRSCSMFFDKCTLFNWVQNFKTNRAKKTRHGTLHEKRVTDLDSKRVWLGVPTTAQDWWTHVRLGVTLWIRLQG